MSIINKPVRQTEKFFVCDRCHAELPQSFNEKVTAQLQYWWFGKHPDGKLNGRILCRKCLEDIIAQWYNSSAYTDASMEQLIMDGGRGEGDTARCMGCLKTNHTGACDFGSIPWKECSAPYREEYEDIHEEEPEDDTTNEPVAEYCYGCAEQCRLNGDSWAGCTNSAKQGSEFDDIPF